jgi:hypothetical protein
MVWRFVAWESRKRRRRLTAAAVTEEVLDSSPTPGPQADNKSADSLTAGGIEMDNTQIQQLNRWRCACASRRRDRQLCLLQTLAR